jgi:hypothetical protein
LLATAQIFHTKTGLTLLRSALGSRERRFAGISHIRTGVELLIAAPLQRGANVDESVTLDRERAARVARVQDGRRSDATERAGEGLRVCLAGQDGGGRGAKEEREDGGVEKHVWVIGDFGDFGGLVKC